MPYSSETARMLSAERPQPDVCCYQATPACEIDYCWNEPKGGRLRKESSAAAYLPPIKTMSAGCPNRAGVIVVMRIAQIGLSFAAFFQFVMLSAISLVEFVVALLSCAYSEILAL